MEKPANRKRTFAILSLIKSSVDVHKALSEVRSEQDGRSQKLVEKNRAVGLVSIEADARGNFLHTTKNTNNTEITKKDQLPSCKQGY